MLRAHNRTPNNTGLSSFEILYGRKSRPPSLPQPCRRESPQASEWLAYLADIDARVALAHDWEAYSQKQTYDKGRSPSQEYKEGDTVWYLRRSAPGTDKLLCPWTGPCPIKKVKGKDSYTIEYSEGKYIDVAPDSLKPYYSLKGREVPLWWTATVQPRGDTNALEPTYEVAEIVGHKLDPQGRVRFRTRWENYGEGDDSWEYVETFLPHYNPALLSYLTSSKLSIELGEHLPKPAPTKRVGCVSIALGGGVPKPK